MPMIRPSFDSGCGGAGDVMAAAEAVMVVASTVIVFAAAALPPAVATTFFVELIQVGGAVRRAVTS